MADIDMATGITRIIPRGFKGIEFQSDLKKITTPCKILVIGLGEFFSPSVGELINNPDIEVQILTTKDDNILKTRANSLDWVYGDYKATVAKDFEKFTYAYANKNNIIKLYSKYPFGLYIKVENYSWFTPLWNVWYSGEAGTAIHQRTLEVISDSYFGEMLELNFDELWGSADSANQDN